MDRKEQKCVKLGEKWGKVGGVSGSWENKKKVYESKKARGE
jgi:hypothetical protein